MIIPVHCTIHTARRSFAMNLFLQGFPPVNIMKLKGHRTEKAFMKYIKISQEQNAELMGKHSYFSKSPLKAANK